MDMLHSLPSMTMVSPFSTTLIADRRSVKCTDARCDSRFEGCGTISAQRKPSKHLKRQMITSMSTSKPCRSIYKEDVTSSNSDCNPASPFNRSTGSLFSSATIISYKLGTADVMTAGVGSESDSAQKLPSLYISPSSDPSSAPSSTSSASPQNPTSESPSSSMASHETVSDPDLGGKSSTSSVSESSAVLADESGRGAGSARSSL